MTKLAARIKELAERSTFTVGEIEWFMNYNHSAKTLSLSAVARNKWIRDNQIIRMLDRGYDAYELSAGRLNRYMTDTPVFDAKGNAHSLNGRSFNMRKVSGDWRAVDVSAGYSPEFCVSVPHRVSMFEGVYVKLCKRGYAIVTVDLRDDHSADLMRVERINVPRFECRRDYEEFVREEITTPLLAELAAHDAWVKDVDQAMECAYRLGASIADDPAYAKRQHVELAGLLYEIDDPDSDMQALDSVLQGLMDYDEANNYTELRELLAQHAAAPTNRSWRACLDYIEGLLDAADYDAD